MNKNQRTKCDRCCCKKFKSADETCWMFPSVVELFLSNIYYTPSKPVLRALLSHRGGRRERVSSFTIPPPAKTGNRLFPLPSLFFFEHNSNSTSGLILPSFLFSLPGTLPPSFFFFFFFFFLSCCQLVGWGGHGVVGMWAKVLLLCAAEGNKPKASPSQPQPRFSTSIFF